MSAKRCAAWLALSALAWSSAACTKTSSCSRDADSAIVSVKPGMVEGNTYHSAPIGGPYEYFPPMRTVSFEHGLGVVPYAIQFWLAFSDHGTLAPSAGNMTELRALDDADLPITKDSISVYNNTCSEFYLWVVAERPSP
jgi:hypothetical protein